MMMGEQSSDLERPEVELREVQGTLSKVLQPDFEVLRPLGSGRAAHVFLAREAALKRLVAVKVLRADVGKSDTARARFEREARSSAGISHPQVPAVYRVGKLASGLPFMVQEYIEGRTLGDRLEAMGAIPAQEARKILVDLASALSASHAKGIIHRDVRPGKIMLSRDTGRAFLMDFGLAAVRDSGTESEARLTQTGEILGDPQYASPEQLRGEPVTAQTDLYSLGVVGYEILTLSNPFGSDSRQELFIAHLRGDPKDLPWEVIAHDRELGEVLKRCLRKEPSKRPRAEEVRRALARQSGGAGGSSAAGFESSGGGLLAEFPRFETFVQELRRRRVYQVGAAYVVAGLLVLDQANNILEGLEAPSWIYRTIMLTGLAGFPVVLVLSWVYDVTRTGIERTEPTEGRTGRTFKIVGLAGATVLAVLVGWLLLD